MRSSAYWAGISKLPEIAERLRLVQIEHRPALQVIRQLDDPAVLFYCDPPYVLDTRSAGKAYRYELADGDHADLADALNAAKGRVAVSGYPSTLYEKAFPARRWRQVTWRYRKASSVNGRRQIAIECVWLNFDPAGKRLRA